MVIRHPTVQHVGLEGENSFALGARMSMGTCDHQALGTSLRLNSQMIDGAVVHRLNQSIFLGEGKQAFESPRCLRTFGSPVTHSARTAQQAPDSLCTPLPCS